MSCFTLADLRKETLGYTYSFNTPFGKRYMTYADYIASGRNLRFFERFLLHIQESYANTHTEDDITGKSTTKLLHEAEARIKAAVNGDESTCIISTGTGATGAIHKLQEILGISMPPHTRDRINSSLGDKANQFWQDLKKQQPVVFVSAYEHHSNEVTWRESLCEVVEIGLTDEGLFDLDELKTKLDLPEYKNRLKIGSFSAASNVTGIKSPVYDMARIMHAAGGIVCFDYAASAPYVEINMNKDKHSYYDALFISPHKFLGGPGANGILLFRKELYRSDLAPTCGGGGTVDYVSPTGHDFVNNIEEREKAGTPGTLQLIKAALAFDLKKEIGIDQLEKQEHQFISRAMKQLGAHKNIEILGNQDPEKRISIMSFNIRQGEKYLHPKFVTRLLNDLFGIQSRAGCSCAGPYGHHLLNIDNNLSSAYRQQILQGCNSLKPGWVRVGFHYSLSEDDFNFICDAIQFVADYGYRFLKLYSIELATGTWTHLDETEESPVLPSSCDAWEFKAEKFDSDAAVIGRRNHYQRYLEEAMGIAEKLGEDPGTFKTLSK
jgi:selenocysteine lyase/cysteine desulfurase